MLASSNDRPNQCCSSEGAGCAHVRVRASLAARPDYSAAAPLPPEELERLFGTQQPTAEMIRRGVEETGELFEILERGQCAYIIAYKDGRPDELFFAGYSFD